MSSWSMCPLCTLKIRCKVTSNPLKQSSSKKKDGGVRPPARVMELDPFFEVSCAGHVAFKPTVREPWPCAEDPLRYCRCIKTKQRSGPCLTNTFQVMRITQTASRFSRGKFPSARRMGLQQFLSTSARKHLLILLVNYVRELHPRTAAEAITTRDEWRSLSHC